MVHFVLTGHGKFALGVADALHMVAGDVEDFTVLPFLQADAGTFPETLTKAITDSLEEATECIVFCDLKGGTPFNVAMMAAAEDERIHVVCGVNLPMLIETVFYRQSFGATNADALVERAVAAGKDAIEELTGAALASDSVPEDEMEDGI